MLPKDIKDFSFNLHMIEAGQHIYNRRVPPRAVLTYTAEIYKAMRAFDPDPLAVKQATASMLEAGKLFAILPKPASHLKPLRILEIYYAMRKAQ